MSADDADPRPDETATLVRGPDTELYRGMRVERHWPRSSGWVLDVRRYRALGGPAQGRRPVLLVPGYCMNTTPLGFHPSGPSLIISRLAQERVFAPLSDWLLARA